MDTKSKSIKYSKGLKIIAIITLCISVLGIVGSGLFLINHHDQIIAKTYYDTYTFNNKYLTLIHNIVESKAILKSEKNVREAYDKEEDINFYLDHLTISKRKLANNKNILYYLKNNNTKEIHTNTSNKKELDKVLKEPVSNYLYNLSKTYYSLYYYLGEDVERMLKTANCDLFVTTREPLEYGDSFYSDYKDFMRIKCIYKYALIILVICNILLITTFIYLLAVAGRKKKDGEIKLLFVDKIPLEIHTFGVLLFAFFSLAIASNFDYYIMIDNFHIHTYEITLISVLLVLDTLIGLCYILSITRLIKKSQFAKSSIIYRILSRFKKYLILCLSGKMFKVWIIALLLGYGFINGILFHEFFENGSFIFFLILAIFNAVVIYFSFKSLASLSRIMEATKAISEGNLDYKIDTSEISTSFLDFSMRIQNIQGGIRNAVNRALKGEHMKTALITNVSHDLKTPLTSIITYVDLLKKEEINNEKADEYLKILDEKSNRLKRLIEDLIEASKVSSGNVTVKLGKVNFNELLNQACGEYEDKINASGLDVIIKAANNQTYICADGKSMWRILENLLVNVLKYSAPKSRVYIDLKETESEGILTIKNISANPLNISAEQLTERFVRGDESRTTEGSGLGLSIAQNLTTLQKGTFEIKIDGDLFKAIISMPLWLEEDNL